MGNEGISSAAPRPLIVPVFITGQGCPQRCIFCSGRTTAGPPEEVSESYLREKVLQFRGGSGRKAQLAFYGGNFTGLAVPEQERLLGCAGRLVEEALVESVRISTRPDYITPGIASFLKERHVATVELGAESMLDRVLAASCRGHTAGDVAAAVAILKANGLQTGLHLMAGLPQDTPEGFLATVKEAISLRPDMVRVHPAIVFEGTELAGLYETGLYTPLTMEAAIDLCKAALVRFTLAGIPVIRMGLQQTPEMEKKGRIKAGPFHPSFGMLVESAVFLEMAGGLLAGFPVPGCSEFKLVCSPRDESSLRGMKNSNLEKLAQWASPARLELKTDGEIPPGSILALAAARILKTSIKEFYGGVSLCSNQDSRE